MSGHQIIVGFDPGSIDLGWSCLCKGRYADGGVLSAPKKDSFEKRRIVLREHIEETMSRVREFVDEAGLGAPLVAVEDPQSRSMLVAKKLACIRTMIEEAAAKEGWDYVTVHPSKWQRHARNRLRVINALTPEMRGRGGAKVLSLEGAMQIAGIRNQDQADAFWVASYASTLRRG